MSMSSTGVFWVRAWLLELVASVSITDANGDWWGFDLELADDACCCEKTRAWLTCVPTTGVVVTERCGWPNWPTFVLFGGLFDFRSG